MDANPTGVPAQPDGDKALRELAAVVADALQRVEQDVRAAIAALSTSEPEDELAPTELDRTLSDGPNGEDEDVPDVPADTQPAARVCPLCGRPERVAISAESQHRDVSTDRWRLTPRGQAALAQSANSSTGADGREGSHADTK